MFLLDKPISSIIIIQILFFSVSRELGIMWQSTENRLKYLSALSTLNDPGNIFSNLWPRLNLLCVWKAQHGANPIHLLKHFKSFLRYVLPTRQKIQVYSFSVLIAEQPIKKSCKQKYAIKTNGCTKLIFQIAWLMIK